MNIVFLLLLVSFFLVCLITLLFVWTVKSGQYDDMDMPSFEVLQDDDKINDDENVDDGHHHEKH